MPTEEGVTPMEEAPNTAAIMLANRVLVRGGRAVVRRDMDAAKPWRHDDADDVRGVDELCQRQHGAEAAAAVGLEAEVVPRSSTRLQPQ